MDADPPAQGVKVACRYTDENHIAARWCAAERLDADFL